VSRPPGRSCLLVCLLAAWWLPASGHTSSGVPTLFATSGPDFEITLKTAAGANVRRLPAGAYRIVVTDRTGLDSHNFRLRGFGVNRATGVPFVGTQTWTVRFARGRVYRFLCDPHAFVMRGSFRIDAPRTVPASSVSR
jgi:hypothetical protein